MSIACPHCKAVLRLKGLKPGRFRPTCPGCSKEFVLLVPDEPGGKIGVQRNAAPKSATPGPVTNFSLWVDPEH